MTELKRILIRLDYGGRFHGHLIDTRFAIYSDGRHTYLIGVKKTRRGKYLQNTGHMIIGESAPPSEFPRIMARLFSMSAYELITRHIDWTQYVVDFDLVE